MIIGIDISSIPYGTGVSNYTLNLVRSLIALDQTNQYKLLFYSLRQPLPPEIKKLSQRPNVRIYHYRLPPTFFEYVWNRFYILPVEIFIGKCDVFHTWDWLEPPTLKAKSITTVHDLAPFLFPEYQHQKTIQTHRQKMYRSSQHTAGFICVSKNTQSDLLRLYPQIPTNRAQVIYEAAENKYDRFLASSLPYQQQKKEDIYRQYGLKKFILAQGTREPRKNLKRLIDAFTLYHQQNPKSKIELAITGKYGWGQDIDHLKNPFIKILGYIPEKDMVALHATAMCLVYPSLYEGFGLPILKSMKVGTPVITGNVSSLPEVSGSAALLVNPESTEDIAQAINKILNSPKLRQSLARRGLVQASLFSWAKTAKETLAFYEKIYSSNLS